MERHVVKYKHKSDYYRVLFVYLEVEKQYTLGGWPSSIIEPRCIRGRSYITSLLLRGSTRKQAVRSLQPEVGGLQRQGEARHVGQGPHSLRFTEDPPFYGGNAESFRFPSVKRRVFCLFVSCDHVSTA